MRASRGSSFWENRMRRLSVFLIAVLGALAGEAAAQEMYKVVGPNGRVTYTNQKPPAGANATVVANAPQVSTYTGTPIVTGKPAAVRPAAAPRAEVKLYATDWCGYCRQARAYLASRGVRYTELDIEKSPAARAEYQALGARGVPVILVGA